LKTIGIIAIAVLICILVPLPPAQAQPTAFPHQFYGDVTVGGEAAPLGTVISTRVKGIDSGIVNTWEQGKYGWGRPGVPGCLYQANLQVQGEHISNGDIIEFYINNFKADQTAIFQSDEMTILNLTVASAPPAHTWSFGEPGFFPKHLPDSYIGQVVLFDIQYLATIPNEVQGVYWWNGDDWLFWAPGAPGCTLSILGGGHTYDYMVSITGACEWNIPLSFWMSCVVARDIIQDALNAYNTQYQEWPTADGQPGDIEWTKLVPDFMAGVPYNDSLCDWSVNSDPEGEVCRQGMT